MVTRRGLGEERRRTLGKKKANGEGSVARYKDGRWCARHTFHLPGGRPLRKAFYGRTKAEALAKRTKAVADYRDGRLVLDQEKLTLGEHLTRWLEESVRGNVRPRTLDNYRLQVERHISPALGSVKLKDLSPAHVQRLIRDKLDSGLSPASVRYVHAVLRRALRQAVRWGLAPRNAAEAVDLPKLVRKEARALSPEEARRFLAACSGERLEALYVLGVTSGLRQGELLGLKWEDVDLDRGTLLVRRQIQRMRDGSGLAFLPLKNPESRREVALGPMAVSALRKHRARQAEEKLMLGSLYDDRGLIFTTGHGTPLEATNVVDRSFKPLLRAAGLPDIRFHDLRHTCATLMLSMGLSPKVAQERLGHADVSVTMGIYSHVTPETRREAAGAIEDLLGSAG